MSARPDPPQPTRRMTPEEYDVYHEELATSEGMRESPDSQDQPRRAAGTDPGAGAETT